MVFYYETAYLTGACSGVYKANAGLRVKPSGFGPIHAALMIYDDFP